MTGSEGWTLEIKIKSGRPSYRVRRGATGFNVAQSAVCFRPEDVTDGCPVEVVLGAGGQPSQVTVPGKSVVAPKAVVPPPSAHGRPRSGAPGNTATVGRGRGAAPASRRPQSPPRRDATAPYNFVTAEPPLSFVDDPSESRYSGSFVCTGKALTPLLVAGPQTRATVPAERTFFTVDGEPVIPGTSLKGMIRSMVEAFSRAPMEGFVSSSTLGTRNVSEPESQYLRRFKSAVGEGRLRAGWLEQRGADRVIRPCEYVRVRLGDLGLHVQSNTPARQVAEDALQRSPELRVRFDLVTTSDSDGVPLAERPELVRGGAAGHRPEGRLVPTGGMALPQGRAKDTGYVFHSPKANAEITLADEVVRDFEDQRTKSQDELLAFYRRHKLPVPVFYLVDTSDSDESERVSAYGLCKYFRVRTRFSPAGKASRLPDSAGGRSMSEMLFGSIGILPRRGRVRCTMGRFGATPATIRFPGAGALVAGNPAASAVAMYLVQDSTDSFQSGGRNRNLLTYDDAESVLRGRKFYWHRHDPSAPPPPNQNRNVQAIYRPLQAGVTFVFTVVFERLTLAQVGAVCEAIDFPVGHAHKLGLGKPFGLGSVRLDVDWERTRITADRERYASLLRRLEQYAAGGGGAHATSDARKLASEARERFRAAVLGAHGGSTANFEDVPHVRQVRALTCFDTPPDPLAIVSMPLKASPATPGAPSYATKAILDEPGAFIQPRRR